MKELRELIETKLTSIDSSDSLMNTLKDMLIKVTEHQEQFLEEIKSNVESSYKITESTDIFTTLIEKSQLPKYNGLFYPMIDTTKLNDRDVLRNIKKQIPFVIDTCYIHLDYNDLKSLVDKDCIFEGKIIDDKGFEYTFNFKLYKNESYEKVHEELYDVFYKNNIEWKTINAPYIRKIFDITICYYMDDTSSIETINRIEFDFKQLKKHMYLDYIPVWNIEKREELCQQKRQRVAPLEEKIYYKYDLDIEVNKSEAILINSQDIDIQSIIRQDNKLAILTLEEANRIYWEIYSFKSIDMVKGNYLDIKYPIFSNSQREYNFNKYISKYYLRTMAEIKGIISSFRDLKDFNIVEVKIFDEYDDGIYGEDYNFFIKNRLIPYDLRKVLLVVFNIKEKNEFTYDLIHFILSHLQLIFPEYRWRGDLK